MKLDRVYVLWETIERSFDFTERLKVPGGWLVRCIHSEPNDNGDNDYSAIAMTFLPDPEWKWTI
jgi:hypothetical protein